MDHPSGQQLAELQGASSELKEAFARLNDAITNPDTSRAVAVARSAKLGERLKYWLDQLDLLTGGKTK